MLTIIRGSFNEYRKFAQIKETSCEKNHIAYFFLCVAKLVYIIFCGFISILFLSYKETEDTGDDNATRDSDFVDDCKYGLNSMA